MSVIAMSLWLYTLITFRPKEMLPSPFTEDLKSHLQRKSFDGARKLCMENPGLLSSIVLAGLDTRMLGTTVMIDAMKSEGKRKAAPFWQRLSLLNDIAIVSPMLGLLGTVMGMFYAFYDVNRSVESINALFDGLGIAVGTTVLGLIVAILAMVFSTTLKYRFIKTLGTVEREAFAFSTFMPKAEE
jgi:biopolymer transport protein ExbB